MTDRVVYPQKLGAQGEQNNACDFQRIFESTGELFGVVRIDNVN
jgi:hypothetical protein